MKGTWCAHTPEEITRLRRQLYPSGFTVRPIAEQVRDLAAVLSLEPDEALRCAARMSEELPHGADGLFAVLQPDAFGSVDATLSVLLAMLRERRPFFGFVVNELGPVQLWQDERTMRAFGQVSKEQAGPIVVVPAQLGIMYAGRTAENALTMLDPNEFALGPAEVCSMILTHPSWSQHIERFQVLCPGARYMRRSAFDSRDGEFVPRFGDDEVAYDAVTMRYVRPFAGMATGFLQTAIDLSGPGV